MTDEIDHLPGADRRGRSVYARGPIIRTLELASMVSSILALIAIIVAIVTLLARAHDIQVERWHASIDTCYAIRSVSLRVIRPRFHPTQVLYQAGLGDCVSNANRITGLHVKRGGKP